MVKRKSFTIRKKVEIARKYKKGVEGFGYVCLSKKFGIPRTSIRRWVKELPLLEVLINKKNENTNISRRLKGAGRKSEFPKMESALNEWIIKKNDLGLRVIDTYIKKKGLDLYNASDFVQGKKFTASSGWLQKFKKRFNFVSRRHTTSSIIPPDAKSKAIKFLSEFKNIIEKYNIKPENIFNMDQVPRYFEAKTTNTITKKGSKNIQLRKGSSSHKRFTVTFTITLSGKILKPHLLFSKLKHPPKVCDGVVVDVNNTGMWNQDILKKYFKKFIFKGIADSFNNEHKLLIFDSYTCHKSIANTKLLSDNNVHTLLIPGGMTPLLQPLDVALNRSFQTYYTKQYDSYIEIAIHNKDYQTRTGNIKIPQYLTISKWVYNWTKSKTKSEIINSFKICGLVLNGENDITKLHKPLYELITKKESFNIWLKNNADFIEETNTIEYYLNEYIWKNMPCRDEQSLYYCLGNILNSCPNEIKCKVIEYMIKNDEISDIINTTNIINNNDPLIFGYGPALYAFSVYEKCKIIIIDTDINDIIIFGTMNIEKMVLKYSNSIFTVGNK